MNNFNVVPSQGKFGESISVINQNFQIAQQEMQVLENIASPSRKYATVVATSQTESETDVLPPIGSTDTIYRVGNWDGTQYNDSVFSEYAWNGSAYIKLSTKSQVGEVYDISANHADTKYANLAAALGTNGANIPQSLRKGGMSVKYVQSSDNKYVQYFLTKNGWSASVDDWEKMNLEEEVSQLDQKVFGISGGIETIIFNSGGTEHSSQDDRISVSFPKGEKFALRIDSDATISNGQVYATYKDDVANRHPIGSILQSVEKKFTAADDIVSIGVYFIISTRSDVSLTIDKTSFDDKIKQLQNGVLALENGVLALENRILPAFSLIGKGDTIVNSLDYKVQVGGVYLLSLNNINIDMSGVSSAGGVSRLLVKAFAASDTEIENLISVAMVTPLKSYYQFTIPETTEYIRIYMRAANNAKQTFWLEDISGVDESYITKQLRSDMQNGLIENILRISNFPDNQAINGITFTNNQDGTITVNGTATANAVLQFSATYKSLSALGIKTGVNYYMRGCPAGGSATKYKFNLDTDGGAATFNDFGEGAIVNISSNVGTYKFRIIVYSGQTVNNLVFAPSFTEYKGAIKDHEERLQSLKSLFSPIVFENNGVYNVHGTIGDTASLEWTSINQYKSARIPCTEGDLFIVNATAGGDSAKAFTFVDSNKTILAPLFGTTAYNGVVVAPKGAAYIIISSNNKNLDSYSGQDNVFIDTRARVMKIETKALDFSNIQGLANNDGTFNSFSLRFPGFGDCSPMILSVRAKYVITGSSVPTIRFASGLYTSPQYTIGKNGEFTFNEWRIPPTLFNEPIIISVTVPTGCSLYITEFSCHKERGNNMKNIGVRLNAHLGFQSVAPENTMAAFELAAKCGYSACIVNPIANADGTIYCYHEDDQTLIYNSSPVALSALQFAALSDADIANYRVIGTGNQRNYFNEKIPTLDEFLYLCSLTGIRPILATHPAPSDAQWNTIKNLLVKYNLLNRVTIKAFDLSILEKAFSILGTAQGFVYDVGGVDTETYCDSLDNSTLSQFNGEKGIEYVTNLVTQQVVEDTLSRGYLASVWEVGQITGDKYKELIKWGITEFTDDFNCCSGLNF